MWYTILCNFFSPETFWNTSVPLLIFSVLWDKIFERKSWYPLPIHKNFRWNNFSENWRNPPRIFSVLWDKKVSIESRDIPFLSIKIFDKRTFLRNEGFPNENFRYCEKIIIRLNCETPSYAIFFNPELFWNTRVPLRRFSVLWDKKVSKENRDIPLLAIQIFDKRTFLKTEGIPYEVFRYCEKIIFRHYRNTQSYAIFLFPNFSEKRVPVGVFSVEWDKKVSRENRDIPFLSIKIFEERIFSEKWRVSLRNFSVLWENHYSTKSWYTILCNFFIPEIFRNKRVPLRIISVLWDEKVSR